MRFRKPFPICSVSITPKADAIFDFEREFEFLDKELGELYPERPKPGGTRFVDMLVKVFLKDATEEWILVHIEIQGERTTNFAFRMLQYWYRVFDRYQVNISALAVFTGGKKQKRPDHFHKSFMGTEITYRYNVYHVLDHKEGELLDMDNPFALVVLAAQKALLSGKVPEKELGEQRLLVARALIASKQYNHEGMLKFLYCLKSLIYIENPEINRNFDKEIDLLTGNKNTMGIIEAIKKKERDEGLEKGREEGREEANYGIVVNLINDNFPVSKIANLANVTEAYVKKVKRALKK